MSKQEKELVDNNGPVDIHAGKKDRDVTPCTALSILALLRLARRQRSRPGHLATEGSFYKLEPLIDRRLTVV